MSDWLTHILIGWAIFEVISYYKPKLEKYRSLFLLGSILPDIGVISMFLSHPSVSYLSFPFKSFFGIFLFSSILLLLFLSPKQPLKTPFLFLVSPAFLHLLLDSLYWSWLGRLAPFFPLSLTKFGLNIFSHRSEVLLLPSFLLAVSLTILCHHKNIKEFVHKINFRRSP